MEIITNIAGLIIIVTLGYTMWLMEQERIETNKYIRKLEDKLYKCETGR